MTAEQRDRVGLVLGAGGVRGCAHAGVIEVLRREGVAIDLVVGASVGAIFGLAVASGVPSERVSSLTLESTTWDLFRFYASRLRTERRNPIARLLREAGLDRTFDDLELPFAVLATDMATGEPVVINSGPVLPAVEASFALPLIARPVSLNGSFYLDGGIASATPVHVARDMGADRVIAVDLGANLAAGMGRRAWTRAVAARIGRQRRPIAPRWSDQIRFGCRLYAGHHTRTANCCDADLWIRPNFAGVGPNSITGAHFCYRQGMEAARGAVTALQGWPRALLHSHQPLEEVT